MFRRLYDYGGVAYVLGGIAVLAMIPAPAMFGLLALGVHVSNSVLIPACITFLVGGMIVSVVFDGNNMQVVAQNKTTEELQRLRAQLAEQAEASKPAGRGRQRRRARKQAE